jgi:hypothetical protein
MDAIAQAQASPAPRPASPVGVASEGTVAEEPTATGRVCRNRLQTAVTVVAASRLVLFLIGALTILLASAPRLAPVTRAARLAAHMPFPPGSTLGYIVGPWTHWDGTWFIGIAEHGYLRYGSQVFFPLYPYAARALAFVTGGNISVGGVLLSLLCYAGATVFLYRMIAEDFSPTVALWTVVFLAVFPTSFFFQAVYSESLFLLTTVACFFWARRGRWWLAGLAGFAAVLTRNSGLLLLVPMAMYYLQIRGWSLRRVDRQAGWLLAVPAGLLFWMAYLGVRYGDPLLFSRLQGFWGRSLAFPLVTLFHGTVDLGRAVGLLLVGQAGMAAVIQSVVPFAATAAVILFVVLGWRRLPAPYTAYAVASLLFPLSLPVNGQAFYSMARFAIVIFPMFVSMALVAQRRPRLRAGMTVACVAGLVWLSADFAHWMFIG